MREHMISDGKIHRIKGESGKSGWYVSHGAWGAWGDWATGEKHTFCDERISHVDIKIARRINKKEEILRHLKVAKEALSIWETADNKWRHNYMLFKSLQPYIEKWWDKFMIIPLCDVNGKIWNIQKIDKNGNKWFLKDGRKKGCMLRLGEIATNTIICEGYATGLTIHQATNLPIIVAFDAYNLWEVCRVLTKKHRDTNFYIACDNDEGKPHAGNTGVREALRCYSEFHVGIIKPDKFNDFNDMKIALGSEEIYRQFKFLI